MGKIGMKYEDILLQYKPNRENNLTDCDMWEITK